MNTFTIEGQGLPENFTATKLKNNTGKEVDEVVVNNHLSKEELQNKFAVHTTDGKAVRKNISRSLTNKYGKIHIDELIENYHYFICPVLNIPVVNFENNHFRRLGINKTRFLELFPYFENCYTYAPFITLNKQKKKQEKLQEASKQQQANNIKVNNKLLDINQLLKLPLEKSLKDYFNKQNIKYDDAIKDYHYYECPITHCKFRTLSTSYFNILGKFGITETDFVLEFPDVAIHKKTPYSRGISYNEYLNGFDGYYDNGNSPMTRLKQKAVFQQETYSGNFNLRHEDKTLAELLDIIKSEDDYTIQYYIKFNRDKNITLDNIAKTLGKSIDELVEFEDYFIHPLIGTVCSRITVSMISPFGISKEKFLKWFPNHTGATKALINKIEEVKTIKGSHQVGSAKRKLTMNSIVPGTDKTVQEISTDKMLFTKLNTFDEYGRNVYQVYGAKNISKSLMTRNIAPISDRYLRYEAIIDHITHKLRDYYRLHGYELAQITSKTINSTLYYQLDHKYSITQGYNDSISPLAIAHARNIEPMTVKDNSIKGNSCSISLTELCHITGYSEEEMNSEFYSIMDIIDQDIVDGKYNIVVDVLERAGSNIANKLKPYYEFNRMVNSKSQELINENLLDGLFDYYFPL